MKIKITKEPRPGFTKHVNFSRGEIQLASMSRPSGDVHYIVAIGTQRVQLSKDFMKNSDVDSAWRNGFDVLPEGIETARTLIAEGIVEEVS